MSDYFLRSNRANTQTQTHTYTYIHTLTLSHSHSHSLTQPRLSRPIIFSKAQKPSPSPPPAMDKENANPIVNSQSGDCEFIGSKRGASVLDASEAAAGGGALAAPAGASQAAAGGGQIPPEWDPYEKVPYICPPNPYDTCMDDPWNEVTMVCSLFFPHSSLNPIFAGSLVTISADL